MKIHGEILADHDFTKEIKLNILTEYDLSSFDSNILIDLIALDKLPKEFYSLVKFGANTKERKDAINKLINSTNVNELVNNNIDNFTKLYNENITIDEFPLCPPIENKETYDEETKEEEIKTFNEIEFVDQIISKNSDDSIFSTGDKIQHIISKEMSKLWNLVLRDNENGTYSTLNKIKNDLCENSIFKKKLYELFINEYNVVNNLEIH